MPRTKQVLLRLTEEEYARLRELAGHEPMSSYLRRMAGLSRWSEGDERARRAQGIGDDFPEVQVETLEPFDVKVDESNVAAVMEAIDLLEAIPQFRCPLWTSGCDFTATSPAARCPGHGRKVVPG